MKKMYKYILILTLMMFGFVGEVRAGSTDVHICVEKGTCELKCTYENEDKTEKAYIYIVNGVSSNKIIYASSFSWDDWDESTAYFLNEANGDIDAQGVVDSVNGGKVGVTAFIDEGLLKEENFSCPLNAYKEKGWPRFQEEICFDNNGTYCSSQGKEFKKFNVGNPKEEKVEFENLNYDAQKSKEEVQKVLNKNSDNNEITEICVYDKEKSNATSTTQFVIANFKSGYFKYYLHTYDGNHYFNEITNKNYKLDFEYKTLNESCYSIGDVYYITAYFPNLGSPPTWEHVYSFRPNSQSSGYIKKDEIIMNRSDKWSKVIVGGNEEENPEYNCNTLIGTDLVEEINSYLIYIKIAVPILIIVLGSLDFGKAFISSDEDAMKKAQKKFIMRLIIGMVIFFIPSLINVLLRIANEVWSGISNDTCGITF